MSRVAQVALLVLLLALSQAQATDAALSILGRLAVLSFDSPVTQQFDEAASASVPHADPAGEAVAHVQAAAMTASGRARIAIGIVRATATLSFGITRAPPSA